MRQDYYDRQDLYRDSVLMVAEAGSEEYLHLKMDVLCARRQYQDALGVSDSWLGKVSDGTHENAFAAFYRYVVYECFMKYVYSSAERLHRDFAGSTFNRNNVTLLKIKLKKCKSNKRPTKSSSIDKTQEFVTFESVGDFPIAHFL